MPCTHARFDHLQHYHPNNVALAKCKPRSRSISDCSACYIISHNRGKESGKKGRRKLRKTGKSTFVEQQESLARVYVCIHNELRLLPSKRDEPKRGPGQNASRTNTKNHPFTAERAFEIRHQITLLPQNAIAPLYSRNKATASATTYFSRHCHVHVLAAAAYASPQFDKEHTQKLKNAWGPRSACSGGGAASQTARDNCWRPRFIVFAPRFVATSRRFK